MYAIFAGVCYFEMAAIRQPAVKFQNRSSRKTEVL